jgi:hypothetical protein
MNIPISRSITHGIPKPPLSDQFFRNPKQGAAQFREKS